MGKKSVKIFFIEVRKVKKTSDLRRGGDEVGGSFFVGGQFPQGRG